MRLCPRCERPLERRDGESASQFSRRKTCGRKCAAAVARSAEKGKLRFESRAKPGVWLTAQQYLAEVMLFRKASAEGRPLPSDYANHELWAEAFLLQVRLASRLLSKFRLKAVSAALKAPEGRKVYSLGAPWIQDRIKREDARLAREEASLQDTPVVEVSAEPVGPVKSAFVNNSSTVGKLRGL